MTKTISLKNIGHSFTEKPLLEAVTLKCAENEKVCIVGDNGSGKSTLLKIIAGVIEPNSGSLEKSGHIRTLYVPQEFVTGGTDTTVAQYVAQNAGVTLAKRVYALGKELGFDLEKNASKECHEQMGTVTILLMNVCSDSFWAAPLHASLSLGDRWISLCQPTNLCQKECSC